MNYSLLLNRFWALLLMVSVFSVPYTLSAAIFSPNKLKGSTVLVYTKNGKGYVHDNIPAAVACLKEMAAEEKFTVEVTDDASVFTEDNLKKYQLIVFTSTNNDVFDTDAQRLAFRHYIEAGGGFVGVHSVTGTERNWLWFKMMLGETFSWHARFQAFSLKKIDKAHPSMAGVPDQWTREDECYFGKELFPGMKVLMVHEVNSLNPADSVNIKKNMGTFSQYYPAVWYQQFEGGNIWVTTLGHSKESYQDAIYRNHLLQGLRYIASQFKGLDYSKATALSKDDPLKK
jgi:type 1 glutamine amidotransferase